jgi:hypothetical protein
MQAMPQLTDRSKLPNIIDPMIKNTMDLKHLYQVSIFEITTVLYLPCVFTFLTDQMGLFV